MKHCYDRYIFRIEYNVRKFKNVDEGSVAALHQHECESRSLIVRELRGVYCTQTIAQLCNSLFHMATNVRPYALAFRVF